VSSGNGIYKKREKPAYTRISQGKSKRDTLALAEVTDGSIAITGAVVAGDACGCAYGPSGRFTRAGTCERRSRPLVRSPERRTTERSPFGIEPAAFHIRHIARSIDRLLTYAAGRPLSAQQIISLQTELGPPATRTALFFELHAELKKGAIRIRAFEVRKLDELREVGNKRLPTTLGGVLVHVADHTQRHVGQAITTAKIVSR
jgi:hypothetical protein